MKKLLFIAASVLISANAFAQLKPFFTVDYSRDEKRVSGDDSFSTNLSVGLKTPSKVEYSLKLGFGQAAPGDGNISTNIEGKLKKSYDLGIGALPYVAVRLGEKFESTQHFSHYGFDLGLKMPVAPSTYFDIGTRYRDAFQSDIAFQSWRLHSSVSYDFDAHNTVGLRYSRSNGDVSEAKTGWRVHYTYNY